MFCVQEFINKNWNTDIMSVLLQKPLFEGISQRELAIQLESKKKAKNKLPTWFETEGIYYPPKLHIEQSSSEITAQYKASLVAGKQLLDMTGGFGVDSYFFSKRMDAVLHCEINPELSAIAKHNFDQFNTKHVQCRATDGGRFLMESKQTYDWIFIDPSRRNTSKGKVFLLADSEPGVPELLPILFKRAKKILLKTSPLLDITQARKELGGVQKIHIVAVKNEVKEVLYILEKDFGEEIEYTCANLEGQKIEIFNFNEKEESLQALHLGFPQTYLYEPNPAILKAGAFKTIGNRFGLKKLHRHSHLYTSDKLVEFPGRRFSIKSTIPYNKTSAKRLKNIKANITSRNFPLTVAALRKKHQILDGGENYWFFTKTKDEKNWVICCQKV